jgi:DinB superfamily
MVETAKQYIERLKRTLGERSPLEVMQSTVTVLDSIGQSFGKEKFQQSWGEGKWTAAQILSHLAEGEMVLAYRLREIVANSGANIPAYDQNRWVANAGYLQTDSATALSLFTIIRKVNLAFLNSLDPEQWNCYGVHSERGKESIRDIVQLVAGHDLNHLQQLKTIAGKL